MRQSTQLGSHYPCPSCGAYYSLSIGMPNMPEYIASYWSDEEQEQWVAEHSYNIATCSVCGWNEETDE